MTLPVAVPDWGDSGALYQWISIPEPAMTATRWRNFPTATHGHLQSTAP